MSEKFSVWTEATRRYYYLIPQDYELPSGDFILWSPFGGQKRVDPTVLVPFEVSEAVARQQFRAEANQLTGNIQDTVSHLFAFATQSMSHEGNQNEAFLKWLVRFFGGNSNELAHNPQGAILQLLQRLKDMVEGKAEATADMKSALPVDWANVAEQLKQIDFERDDNLRQALSDLQVLITGLQETTHTTPNEAFRSLYKRYQEYVQQQEEAINPRKYQESVGRSVDEALQKSMKPIEVKSWIDEARAKYRQEKKLHD